MAFKNGMKILFLLSVIFISCGRALADFEEYRTVKKIVSDLGRVDS